MDSIPQNFQRSSRAINQLLAPVVSQSLNKSQSIYIYTYTGVVESIQRIVNIMPREIGQRRRNLRRRVSTPRVDAMERNCILCSIAIYREFFVYWYIYVGGQYIFFLLFRNRFYSRVESITLSGLFIASFVYIYIPD